jgi:hypothetical protein
MSASKTVATAGFLTLGLDLLTGLVAADPPKSPYESLMAGKRY